MSESPGLPQPDPALRRLDLFVGRWSMKGHFVGSDEESIGGEATFRWLPGGFFLEQSIELDFAGLKIESLELIGYDPESDRFPSTVFSNLSPVPLPYSWDCPGGIGDDHCLVPSARRNVHRLVARGRHLLGWLAPQPGRRRDGERALRRQRTPRRMRNPAAGRRCEQAEGDLSG